MLWRMPEIPEEQQASALRQVGEARDALNRAEAALRDAAVHAARIGAPRTRVKALAQVSSKTLYGWLENAGVPIRTKKPHHPQEGTR